MHPGEAPATAPRRALRAAGRGGLRGAVPSRAAERTPDEGGNQHAIRRCSRADSYRDTTMRGVIRGHQTPSGAIRGTRLPRHDDEGDPLACLGLVVRVDLLTVARDLSARGSALLRLVRAQAHLMRGAISMQSLYPTCTCPGAPHSQRRDRADSLARTAACHIDEARTP